MSDNKKLLEQEVERLTLELDEAKAALPAHTIRPHQLMAIEELEERIKNLKKEIESA